MEFGIFVQGHVPHSRQEREGVEAEHRALIGDTDLVKVADRHNWKYVWVTEHHFLTEYSHLSASDVFLGFCSALTDRIHLGSGIFSFNPRKDHPARIAERVAMLDHLSEGRFEFGTGRGAGSREVTGYDIESTEATRPIWDEFIREIPRMWKDEEYSYKGTSFNLPFPGHEIPTRNVLPKPWKKPHPPLWVAAGNPPTFEKAAHLGMGVLAFTTRALPDMKPLIDTYKEHIGDADPVGEYVNDNVMVTSALVCLEDGAKAREAATRMGGSYLQSLVYYYHDTIPVPPGAIRWPDPAPEPTVQEVQWRIDNGYLVCGDPDECAEQLAKIEPSGLDQLVFGLPIDLPHDLATETLELFGDRVITQFDTDPVHSTTRARESAATPGR
jgi:alkanesulfonate monooxygenase SsuD/methylene tetrahydromethanopterin reductase-like flavin-dependent oxidoreductase (luciferase family)